MFRLFYTKTGDQKKWLIFLTAIFPLIFSVWGTIISLRSYNLSVDTSNNKEQIDSMRVMISELRTQNLLLSRQINQTNQLIALNEKSSMTQDQQLDMLKSGVRSSNRPKLNIEGGSSGPNDVQFMISTRTEDAFNFSIFSRDKLKIDIGILKKTPVIARGNYYNVLISGLQKKEYRLVLFFEDNHANKYKQEIILSKNENSAMYDFILGGLTER